MVQISRVAKSMYGYGRQTFRLGQRRLMVAWGHQRSVAHQHASCLSSLRTQQALNSHAWRNFHSTSFVCEASDGAKSGGNPGNTEVDGDGDKNDDDDDEIPVWQNPRHHNDPELQKMFPEDFDEGEEMPFVPLPPLSTDPNKVSAPEHLHQLAHEVVGLSLLEMKELSSKIADHFGFDDSMMAASYAGGGDGGGAASSQAEEEVVEKTQFDLKLMAFDAKAKIKVIKEVRAIAGLGLKEAKELVEGAPKVVQKDISQERAEELKAQLEAVGATVEIV